MKGPEWVKKLERTFLPQKKTAARGGKLWKKPSTYVRKGGKIGFQGGFEWGTGRTRRWKLVIRRTQFKTTTARGVQLQLQPGSRPWGGKGGALDRLGAKKLPTPLPGKRGSHKRHSTPPGRPLGFKNRSPKKKDKAP